MSSPAGFSFHRSRSLEIGHHFDQGCRWLSGICSSEDTTAATYCAFEFRLEIERIAVQFLRAVDDAPVTVENLRRFSSFKRMERRIYEKDGHQAQINKKLEFIEILCGTLEMPIRPAIPDFGRLAELWDRCSDYCHVLWSMAAARDPVTLVAEAREHLNEVRDYLVQFTSPNLAWPGQLSPEFAELRDRFVRGEVSKEYVVAEIKRQGIWGEIEYPDGRRSEHRQQEDS